MINPKAIAIIYIQEIFEITCPQNRLKYGKTIYI